MRKLILLSLLTCTLLMGFSNLYFFPIFKDDTLSGAVACTSKSYSALQRLDQAVACYWADTMGNSAVSATMTIEVSPNGSKWLAYPYKPIGDSITAETEALAIDTATYATTSEIGYWKYIRYIVANRAAAHKMVFNYYLGIKR